MAIVSQAGRPLRQPASGSPLDSFGGSVLGRLRSSGAAAPAARHRGAAGSGVGALAAGTPGVAGGGELGAGAPGSGVGPVEAGAVGGTPGVATGAPASGVTGAGWIGRPCLSYSTTGPPPCGLSTLR